MKEISDKLRDSFDLVRWDNERIRREFGKRSLAQIKKEGSTHYAGSCVDVSLFLLDLLSNQGYKPHLVLEEVDDKRYGFVRLHTALMVFDRPGCGLFTVDPVSCSEVVWYEGAYQNSTANEFPESVLTRGYQLVGGENVTPHATPHNLFLNGCDRPLSSDVQLDAMIEGLCQSNTDERFEEFSKSHEGLKINHKNIWYYGY